ncbi:MAG TPA: ornithine carbamoyltransferase [Nitrospirae bacterium]|nr:ornithine carbamoyltransferase [Nitrospirota bacterium]
MKRDLLRVADLNRTDIEWLFKVAARLKKERIEGVSHRHLEGKTLGMVFHKSSTRTRISFEVGMVQLGGHPIFLEGKRLQMSRGETVADTARIFSRYLDALVIRTYSQAEVDELASVATIPVINALTDMFHPCQILADLFTIAEKRGSLDGVRVAYVGDGNNVANSWLLGASIMGMSLCVATPKGYEPDSEVTASAMKIAEKSGAKIATMTDPVEAVRGADVIYTDTWISMGQEDDQADERLVAFEDYRVDEKLLSKAKSDVMVMHCLPAHRGEEISAEALDGPNSIVWDEAENRLHIQKAILLMLMRGDAKTLYP